MTKGQSLPYVFDATGDHSERERFQVIEKVFDPAIKNRITSVGVTPRWPRLEVGPGSGSILHCLTDKARNDVWVTEVGIDTYCDFSYDVHCWSVYYATIVTAAQLPHKTGTQ